MLLSNVDMSQYFKCRVLLCTERIVITTCLSRSAMTLNAWKGLQDARMKSAGVTFLE